MTVTHSLNWLKNLKNCMENFHQKTPKKKWEIILNVGSKMFSLFGIRVFTDMKNKWYSYIGVLMIFDYIFLISYTLWYNFKKSEYLKGFECTYTAGTVVLVHLKICLPITNECMKSILLFNRCNFSGVYDVLEGCWTNAF